VKIHDSVLKLVVESGEQDLEFIMKMPIPTDEGCDAPRQAKITSHINEFQGVKARQSQIKTLYKEGFFYI